MDIASKLDEILRIEHGFAHITELAQEIFSSATIEESYRMALDLFGKEAYQLRMLSVTLLGYVAVENSSALEFLKEKVSRDENWRVQEMLAKSFDFICKERGYEVSLPLIEEWLSDTHPNVVRAVTEGLRIWTNRPYFKQHPSVAISLLSKHRDHSSEYVRKSVGNALRDISKKYPQLVREELNTWDIGDKAVRQTYLLAAKFIDKN